MQCVLDFSNIFVRLRQLTLMLCNAFWRQAEAVSAGPGSS